MGIRIIDHTTDLNVRSDDFLLKDSSTNGTKKITPEAFINGTLTNYLPSFVGSLTETQTSDEDDYFYTVVNGNSKKVKKSTILSADRTARATAEGTIASNFAQEYSTTTSYAVGDYCIKDLVLYKCTSPTSGTWDSSKWTQADVSDISEDSSKVQDVTVNGGSVVDNNKNAVLDSLVAYGEVSGSIASFSDGSELPMRSLKVHIEPVQDLHGYDAPWVGGAGKNKLPINSLSISGGGITAIIDRDSNNNVVSVTVNGTASGTVYVILNTFTLPSGTYTMSGCPSNGGTDSYRLYDDKHTSWADNGSGASFTLSEASQVAPTIRIANGYTVNNLKFYPMIESGSEKTTFAPYSNECPISGWTEENISVRGKNMCNPDINAWNVITYRYIKLPKFNNDSYIMSFVDKDTSVDLTGINMGFMYNYPNDSAQYHWVIANGIMQNNHTNISQIDRVTKCDTLIIYPNTVATFEKIFARYDIQVEKGSTATAYEPYNGSTYTIQFTDGSNPLTVYGGYVDIVSGALTVDKVIQQWTSTDSNTWLKYGTNIFYNTWDNNSYEPSNLGEASETICNTYKSVEKALANLLIGEYCFNSEGISSSKASIAIRNDNFTSGADFKNSLNPPLQLVYPLATPQTYQLTAQQVKSLLGVNNVWADTGDVDVHYVRDLTITIDDILSRLEALES